MFDIEELDNWKPYKQEKNALIAKIPQYEEYEYSWDYEGVGVSEYNEKVEKVREYLFLEGWWEAVPLPYEFVNDGILVNQELGLSRDVTFWCNKEIGGSYECFYPSISLDSPNKDFIDKYYKNREDSVYWSDDGFLKSTRILWKNKIEYDEDEELSDSYYEKMEEEIAAYNMNPYTTDLT